MIHDHLPQLLSEEYWRLAVKEEQGRHMPADKLEVPTLDVDNFPARIQVELTWYHLDAISDDVVVYRLG